MTDRIPGIHQCTLQFEGEELLFVLGAQNSTGSKNSQSGTKYNYGLCKYCTENAIYQLGKGCKHCAKYGSCMKEYEYAWKSVERERREKEYLDYGSQIK